MKPLDNDALMRLFLGLLVFRLGGEQSFSAEEINDIRENVQGVQILLTENNRIVLRTRNNESCEQAIEDGRAI